MPETERLANKAPGAEGVSFEDALQELEKIIGQLEREKLTLDQSLALYERGQTLGNHCTRLLDQAELKIKQLSPNSDGSYAETAFWDNGE